MEVESKLKEIQKELASVKKALLDNGTYLGMSGEKLQEYFLLLNQKENAYLSKQVQVPQASNFLGQAASGYATALDRKVVVGQVLPVAARPMPEGAIVPFERDKLASVCAHLCQYEASPSESAKALRALASLAYANALEVGEHPEALPQIMRLLELHPSDDAVQVNALRTLCNIAYDHKVASNKLSSREVVNAIVQAVVRKPDSKEIMAKASEAVARVVTVEVNPASPEVEELSVKPLAALFAPDVADQPARDVIVQLVEQLVSNEVATCDTLAQKLVAAADAAKESGPKAAAWLNLAKAIAMKEISNLSDCLIARGVILAAHGVVSSQLSDGPTQLAGIEAMSGLVGTRWVGLQAFAGVRGMECVEKAMSAHPTEVVLQTKGTRALASGVQWPADIQQKAGWNLSNSISLTKKAMSDHAENEELQIAGLEAFNKYLEKTKCATEISDTGAEIVRNAMSRHAVQKVQQLGKTVLDIGGWR
jgi:tetratricopeptide (TPR) repeat protein|mmetsp:Transcript_80802/g.126006  ORF Transcript_80802/g.126006 Transcript_80802/m.126006 type:complete len:480 (-) Transcript_80802:81-1520(-)